jgi:proteic killer suppression protein
MLGTAMIRTFADEASREFWETGKSRKVPADIRRVATRKLAMLHAAVRLDDLRVPPGNRLEHLHGDRQGQHSIRINDQYRLCFDWKEGDAYDVEITDYH